ncbi:hypothetical protein NESM_000086100 [Novymonas esmeraldas]|uniref:Uncharacterized protein n=1 Tax=Novymonas esmeraldas TaxID=1808958 RepID=A0AAW0F3F5_9TRYP
MWSLITQDFSDFAAALKTESAGFMDYLEHMASDAVGTGDVYAGDEVLGKSVREMPLATALLRRLQDAESTYTLPIQPEEKTAFAAWVKASPLSSANTVRRQQQQQQQQQHAASAADTPESKLDDGGATPGRRTAAYPDEPIDETRQRLLDYNERVLQRYVSLVGDAVSPRPSVPDSPSTPAPQRMPGTPPSASSAAAKLGAGDRGSPVATAGATPPTTRAPASVSEDLFFDRYFFRLTQLRVSEAQRSRDAPPARSAGGAAAAAASPSSTATPPPPPPPPAPPSPSASVSATESRTPRTDGVSRHSTEDDDFVAVPLFAKRVMTAASGLVTGIDNALNSVVIAAQPRHSDDDNNDDDDGGAALRDMDEDRHNVDPKDLHRYRSARQQVADLETLVQELQEALRRERRRTAQLAGLLREHGIDVPTEPTAAAAAAGTTSSPPSAEATPATAAETRPSRAQHADPTTSVTAANSGTPAAAAASSSKPKVSAATSSAQSTSGEVMSAATEEEEAWVNVSPGAE